MYQPSQPVAEQVDRTFTYHAPQGDQVDRFASLRNEARDIAHTIIMFTPPSREQSIALTKLQECVMFANAAIAINERWQDGQLTEPTAKQETA